MERGEVSWHELKVAAVLKSTGKWLSNKEIASAIPEGISERTVRSHTLRLVKIGVVDQAEVFPSHRYRWSELSEKRNAAYVQRLGKAAEALSVEF